MTAEEREYARIQPCGCVICNCRTQHCMGCGAKICSDANGDCVFNGGSSRPVYTEHPLEVLAAAIEAAIDARERELVPEVCVSCDRGFDRSRVHYQGRFMWFHHEGRKRCPASEIHEAIYQREQRAADGPADA